MTHAKKLKREIRARARRTGESYVTARQRVVQSCAKRRPAVAAPASSPKPHIGDASVVKATGRGLDHWFSALDAFDALGKGHTASAAHLQKDHGVRAWYAQMITVAYERARGKRVKNQSCAGTFQVNVSKAIPASVEEVTAALRNGGWLVGADPALAAAYPKSPKRSAKSSHVKFRYRWGASTVEIRVTARGGGCTVVADNMKLPDAREVETRRSQWRAALTSLKSSLAK
jgi:hypothetical protein